MESKSTEKKESNSRSKTTGRKTSSKRRSSAANKHSASSGRSTSTRKGNSSARAAAAAPSKKKRTAKSQAASKKREAAWNGASAAPSTNARRDSRPSSSANKSSSHRKKPSQAARMLRSSTIIVLGVCIITVAVGLIIRAAVNRPAPTSKATETAAKEKPKTKGIVFLDAGHGGSDTGDTYGSRFEKDDTLKLALKVKKDLEDDNYKVYMSRSGDTDMTDSARVKAAGKKKAGLVVSIHRDKIGADGKTGIGAYISSDGDTRSDYLAASILHEISSAVSVTGDRGVIKGAADSPSEDYPINEKTKMPSCVLEVGCIDSDADNSSFDKDLETYADAIASGIERSYSKVTGKKDVTQTDIDSITGTSDSSSSTGSEEDSGSTEETSGTNSTPASNSFQGSGTEQKPASTTSSSSKKNLSDSGYSKSKDAYGSLMDN